MIKRLLLLAVLAVASAPVSADEQWLVVDKAEGNCFPLSGAFTSPAAYRDALARQGSAVDLRFNRDKSLAVLLDMTYRSNTYMAKGDEACKYALSLLKKAR